ncbi:sorbosone dehydrogenase family protein [Luteolibacter sp. Populi]|uniref:PQQ-dependent sugar dehydrogenase n=1 Tax=Luteolibacter sp. Populi TaxID=3230487 RepID=UPI0034678DE0
MRYTLLAAALLSAALPAAAKPGTEVVAKGFNRPLWVGAPSHVKDRLWVIEQDGKIWIIDAKSGEKQAEPFLDITEQVRRKGNEEGLLGLAFAPDFEKSGLFYVNFVDKQQNTRISRFKAAGPDFKEADKSSQEVLLSFKQPYENHNGGWVGFGPDGMLYIGNGDGGAGDDPPNNGQKTDTFLGKILRIDVSSGSGYSVPKDNPFVGKAEYKPEIWALGVRNPWRCSFDRKSGDFWIGDVGQNKWEEIDYLPKGKGAGSNFGWRLREADKENPTQKIAGDKPENNVEPVYVYAHGGKSDEGLSVTGGYVYRGPVKGLEGRYIFGDYNNRRVWSFVLKGGKATDVEDHTDDFAPEGGKVGMISSFGEDSVGNVYIVDQGGAILRIVDK